MPSSIIRGKKTSTPKLTTVKTKAQQNLTVTPHELLKQHFGWDEFRDGQEDIISRLLKDRSAVAVFPTGGGKSLCYQLPALAFPGTTIIVSPLIALMKDQIDQLAGKGISAVRLDSSLSLDEYREAIDAIRSGKAKMLYIAPERFFNERFRSILESISISLFAIDEAHCISQWGHNFRPDYLKLAPLVKRLKIKRVLALTATATPQVIDDIRNAFDVREEDAICTSFYRSNLHLRSRILTPETHLETLIDNLKTKPAGPTLVYVSLQKTAMAIAGECVAAGLSARPYHAGLNSDVRNETQTWFMNDTSAIVVATIAFGMGIDKSDIRYVYHFNPPKSLENYAQEIGRAGRDGADAHCEMLLVPTDRTIVENFVYGDTPTSESIGRLMEQIANKPDEFFISHYDLSKACDIKALVLRTFLTYLELDGYIESTAPRYDSYSFKPNIPSTEILANFDGEKRDFAKNLLACATKRKTWFGLDIPSAMIKLHCTRQRIVAAVDYFAERGWLELKVTGLVHGYRRLKRIEDIQALTADYTKRTFQREASEIARIDQVFALASASSCQSCELSSHFGQELDAPCKTCSFCIGEGPFDVSRYDPALPNDVVEAAQELVQQYPSVLTNARVVARVLCGISSPSLTTAKLSGDPVFGKFMGRSFGRIIQEIESAEIFG
jgi:ATP-dependent DNA helicase RecQ